MLRVIRHGRYQRWMLLLALTMLTGCSSLKIAYDWLDYLILGQARDRITLTGEQNNQLKRQLANLHQWHCQTQVQHYARWLRAVNDDIQAGNTGYLQVQTRYEETQAFWRALMETSAASLSELLPSLSDAQVEEYFSNAERDKARLWAGVLELSPAQRRERAEAQMQKHVERWIGDLTPTQQQALQAWSADVNVLVRLEARTAWQRQLRHVVLQRADPKALHAGLHQLLVEPERGWTPEYAAYRTARREQTLQLLTTVGATLTPAQRRRFARRSDGWAEDIEELACSEARRR